MPVIEEKGTNERDIDTLATDMKENLRLSRRSVNRYLPYGRKDVVKEPLDVRILRRTESRKNGSENPYDMLQELLNKGCLIREAVKRLQIGLTKLSDGDDSQLDDCAQIVKDDSENNMTPLRSIP